MNKAENAVQCFKNGYNCSQAVFSTYSEQLGLDRKIALKVACPFGGGMGRMGETCGAVTGAFMLIGLKHGKYLEADNDSKEKSYAMVKDFTDRFTQTHGSIGCRELLKYDMNNPEELKIIKELGLWDSLCPIYIRDTSLIVEEMLELR